jgi:hypothetical protein
MGYMELSIYSLMQSRLCDLSMSKNQNHPLMLCKGVPHRILLKVDWRFVIYLFIYLFIHMYMKKTYLWPYVKQVFYGEIS